MSNLFDDFIKKSLEENRNNPLHKILLRDEILMYLKWAFYLGLSYGQTHPVTVDNLEEAEQFIKDHTK